MRPSNNYNNNNHTTNSGTTTTAGAAPYTTTTTTMMPAATTTTNTVTSLSSPAPAGGHGGFLRTIPEDRSEASSAARSNSQLLAFMMEDRESGGVESIPDSSVRATILDDGRSSCSNNDNVSDTPANLAGGGDADNSVLRDSAGSRGGGGAGGWKSGDRHKWTAGGGELDPTALAEAPTAAMAQREGRTSQSPSSPPPRLSVMRAKLSQAMLNKKFVALFLASCFLFVGVLVAIAAVAVTDERDHSASTSSAAVNSTTQPISHMPHPSAPTQTLPPSPAPAPTIAPETIQTIDDAISLVSNLTQLWANPKSPEYQARAWLITEDLLRDDIVNQGTSRIVQRYVLAHLYYCCNGPHWHQEPGSNGYLLPDQDECEWTGVHCITSGSNGGTTSTDTSGSSTDNGENLRYVYRLSLGHYNLSGTLPSTLPHLSSLQELSLENNSFTGPIPPDWFVITSDDNNSSSSSSSTTSASTNSSDAGWKELYWLDVSQNSLSQTIPPQLWTLPLLRFVYLYKNQLEGTLDGADGTIDSSMVSPWLEDVWLYDNQLTGPLPSWFSDLSYLRKWIAYDNHLSGPLPTELPLNMTQLDLSNNSLSGGISADFWASATHHELAYLYLDNNYLTASLPTDTGNSPSSFLKDLWLHGNSLTGSIPDGFAQGWSALEELILYNNKLTGTLGPVESNSSSTTELIANVSNSSSGNNGSSLSSSCTAVWPNLKKLEADCSTNHTGTESAGVTTALVICDCCTFCW